MKHNYICLIGIIPYGVFGYLWKSNIMLFAFFLGFIFHLNPHNKVIKYIDLSVNVSLSIYAIVLEKKTILPASFSAICYFNNNILHRPKNINCVIYNLKHVFLIQFVGYYGYYLLYKHEPCLEFFFKCDNENI